MILTIVGKDRSRRVLTGLCAGAALLAAGCYKATGGGWIPSATTVGGKANFGFSVKCADGTLPDGTPVARLYEGQLEWNDGPVSFHGDVDGIDIPDTNCMAVRQANIGNSLQFFGTYRPKPSGESGDFQVTVIDNGTPTANGDFIQIVLFSGQHAGYFNEGVLRGGNIQVF